jgi:hypothetical protein
VNRQLARTIWKRASDRCEYYLIPQVALPLPFQIDHIPAGEHGDENLNGDQREFARRNSSCPGSGVANPAQDAILPHDGAIL